MAGAAVLVVAATCAVVASTDHPGRRASSSGSAASARFLGAARPLTSGSGFTLSASSTPQTVSAGGTTPISYTIAAQNTASTTSTAAVTVTDTVPSALTYLFGTASCSGVPTGVTCSASVSGSTITWTISAGVPTQTTVDLLFQAYADAGDQAQAVTDTATWSGPGCSSQCTTNSVTNDISTFTATKSVSPTGTVTAGETLTYTITGQYTNPANTPSSGTLQITDAAPTNTTLAYDSPTCGPQATNSTALCTVSVSSSDGITWNIGRGVPAGTTVAVTFQVVVNLNVQTGTNITNQANYNYSGDDAPGGQQAPQDRGALKPTGSTTLSPAQPTPGTSAPVRQTNTTTVSVK